MQFELASSQWFWAVVGALGGAGGLAGFYKLFLNRKKPKAETHAIEVRADGDELDQSIKANEVVNRASAALRKEELKSTRLEIRAERAEAKVDEWKLKYEQEHTRYRMLEKTLDDLRHGGNGKAR